MNSRKPLRKENLKDLMSEILDRLHELTDEQLEALSIAADQHIFDRDTAKGAYRDMYYSDLAENYKYDDFIGETHSDEEDDCY